MSASRSLLLIAPLLALAACSSEAPPAPPKDAAPVAATPPATPAPKAPRPTRDAGGPHAFTAAITADDFGAHVRKLASDEFEGRGPGTIGERMTTAYLKEQFERLGLKPGRGDSYAQSVPMVETQIAHGAKLTFDVGGTPLVFAMPDEMVVGTRTAKPKVSVTGSDVVFAGYGVVAPEANWNDYEGLDVKGKTVIVLINDPGFIRKDDSLFKGNTMTYYGRWTYKFEECARQGAAACLIVHDDVGAAYPWDVVRNGWTGAQFDLPASEDPDPRVDVQGWLTTASATKLFAAAGKDFEALRQAADQRGFKSLALGAKATTTVESTVRQSQSDNMIAILPGSDLADQAIIYMAHWDHLGHQKSDDPNADTIFNGAIDNGTGVAAVLEIAEAFATAQKKPRRSVIFMVCTLEESGLLGSKYYAAHPVVPLSKTIAAFNIDAMSVAGPARNLEVIGSGQSDLEDTIAEVLKGSQRVTASEATPEKGYYFRSDHFNFARRGVPALYAKSGDDLVDGGTTAGHAKAADYTANRYHKPADEFDLSWDLTGAAADVQAYYDVGRIVADRDAPPQWRADSEFRAAGETLYGTAAK